MSLVDEKGWPVVGATFDYFQDLLLVCNLAALGAGYSNMIFSAPNRIVCGGITRESKAGRTRLTRMTRPPW